jgi:hypothetical protein
MWFQIELPSTVMLKEIQFDSPNQGGSRGGPAPVGTYPRGYQVQVSIDGQKWSAPVAQGQGNAVSTSIALSPVRAKFLRIIQTATVENGAMWSIQGLRLYEAP